jgi:DNA polymerase-3 subunit epsilon
LNNPDPLCINDFMRFIAFDLETTGTVPGVDQIVEIGAVRFIDGVPEAIFATLIDPLRPISAGASAVNGISNDMVKGKPLVQSALPSFAEFCGDDILVAHNAPFDAQFLTADIKKHETAAPKGIIIDTLPIARKVFPGLPNYKLGTLVQYLKIPTTGFHRAEEDATYCGHLFYQMIKRISVGGQAPQIVNLIALTGKAEVRFPQIIRQPKQMDLFGGMF